MYQAPKLSNAGRASNLIQANAGGSGDLGSTNFSMTHVPAPLE